MWQAKLRYSLERSKGLIALGAVGVALAGVWYLGALASTTISGHMPLKGRHDGKAVGLATTQASLGSLPEVLPQTLLQISPQDAVRSNALVPASTLPNPAARPLRLEAASAEDRAKALNCLTMAIYYEAAGQSDSGQAAVAQVVLNRLRNPLFPKNICNVVFQGSTRATGCQFTFTCDGSLRRQPSQVGWKHAAQIAERALNGYVQADVGEATHYHTIWVVPYWRSTVVKVTQIGAHIFYRWAGGLGAPGAFQGQYAGGEPSLAALENPALTTPEPEHVAAAEETAQAIAPVHAATPVVAHDTSSELAALTLTTEPTISILPVASKEYADIATPRRSAPRSAMPSNW